MVCFFLMPLPPQKFREIVFQILYAHDFDGDEGEMVPFMMNELKVTRRIMLDAQENLKKILEKRDLVDDTIRNASTEYSFERISRVEKTILRLSLYELLFDPALPPKVAIAEAIRLCRKFGTPESAHFINAILDGVYKQHGSEIREEPALK